MNLLRRFICCRETQYGDPVCLLRLFVSMFVRTFVYSFLLLYCLFLVSKSEQHRLHKMSYGVSLLLLFTGKDCVEFTSQCLMKFPSEVIWIWRFLFWESSYYKSDLLSSFKLFKLSFVYWVNCVSLCVCLFVCLRNSLILSVKFICMELSMLFLYYCPFNVCKVYSEHLLSSTRYRYFVPFSLSLSLSFIVHFARCLSILLNFSKHQLFISLIFFVILPSSTTWISVLYYFLFLVLLFFSYILEMWVFDYRLETFPFSNVCI